jgi:hypothetical protein
LLEGGAQGRQWGSEEIEDEISKTVAPGENWEGDDEHMEVENLWVKERHVGEFCTLLVSSGRSRRTKKDEGRVEQELELLVSFRHNWEDGEDPGGEGRLVEGKEGTRWLVLSSRRGRVRGDTTDGAEGDRGARNP